MVFWFIPIVIRMESWAQVFCPPPRIWLMEGTKQNILNQSFRSKPYLQKQQNKSTKIKFMSQMGESKPKYLIKVNKDLIITKQFKLTMRLAQLSPSLLI